jgi:hypothetical protein
MSLLELALDFAFDKLLKPVVKWRALLDLAFRKIIDDFSFKLQNAHTRIHFKWFVQRLSLPPHALLHGRFFDLRQGL